MATYPRDMDWGPTVNILADSLIGCYGDFCDIFQEGSWQPNWKHTNATRVEHSSVTDRDFNSAVFLLGGSGSNSTEWIRLGDLSPPLAQRSIAHGLGQCTIQPFGNVFVVTGGNGTEHVATAYYLYLSYEVRPLAPLGKPRRDHACGFYYDSQNIPVS